MLRSYFSSGWAFLIPYLAVYLLYWWAGWPVHPDGGSLLLASGSQPDGLPALLHVYWGLHAVHLVLGAVALRGWCRHQAYSSKLTAWSSLLPWLGLGLLFWIPGAYLEFPSDPWEHLLRINEWGLVDQVAAHSTANKTGYLLPYSLLGGLTGVRQLFWLDFYYTAICLLLCWQYYRLARAVGLEARPAFLFVLLQAVLFGNNVFGFYRYYGLASTMYSQLGAVALVRIGLEVARHPRLSLRAIFRPRLTAYRLSLIASVPALVALIAFNHIQGLGMAILGLAAVAVWRLIAWRRAAIWWLLAATLLLSLATIQWWPQHPALDEIYRPHGWLTGWYGFRMLPIDAAGGHRAAVIIGFAGLLNLAAALWLLRRNHVAGWLVLMPVVALCLPFVAIPIANALAQHRTGPGYIIAYHRLLLGIPVGLALVVLLVGLPPRLSNWLQRHLLWLLPVALAALVTIPTGRPCFNRFWHSLAKPPADLTLHALAADSTIERSGIGRQPPDQHPVILAPHAVGNVIRALGWDVGSRTLRVHSTPPAWSMDSLLEQIHETSLTGTPMVVVVPRRETLQTHHSLAAILSRHWPSGLVALDHAGGPELEAALSAREWRRVESSAAIYYYFDGQ